MRALKCSLVIFLEILGLKERILQEFNEIDLPIHIKLRRYYGKHYSYAPREDLFKTYTFRILQDDFSERFCPVRQASKILSNALHNIL